MRRVAEGVGLLGIVGRENNRKKRGQGPRLEGEGNKKKTKKRKEN